MSAEVKDPNKVYIEFDNLRMRRYFVNFLLDQYMRVHKVDRRRARAILWARTFQDCQSGCHGMDVEGLRQISVCLEIDAGTPGYEDLV